MGASESLLASKLDCLGQAVMDAVRGVKADPRMVMVVVVPVEEGLAEAARVMDRAEALGKLWPVFHSAKLRFRERVVIGNIGPRMGFGDAEIGQ